MTPEKQIEVRERPPNFKTKEELKFGLSERKEKKKIFIEKRENAKTKRENAKTGKIEDNEIYKELRRGGSKKTKKHRKKYKKKFTKYINKRKYVNKTKKLRNKKKRNR